MKLSARLEKLKHLMVPGGVLADVGCDHAWLSIAAARDGSFSRVLAADLRKAPLQAAARHIEEAGLTGTVIPLLSDGLSAVEGPVDVLVIAGMGGQLMTDILRGKRQDGSDTEEDRLRVRGLIRNARQLLLSPQSETGLVRRFLTEELGVSIAGEYWTEDEGKFYLIIDVRPQDAGIPEASGPWSEEEYRFGKKALRRDLEIFRKAMRRQEEFLLSALEKTGGVRTPAAERRAGELREELSLLRRSLEEKT